MPRRMSTSLLALLVVMPLVTNSAIIMPRMFTFEEPTADKMICAPDTLELKCFNDARLRILTAKSGTQGRDICSNTRDLVAPLEGSCHEIPLTLDYLKKKCNEEEMCVIDLRAEPIPNKCPENRSSYVMLKYQCDTSNLPFVPFMKKRYGIELFKNYTQYNDEKRMKHLKNKFNN